MNSELGERVKAFLREPLPIHRHSGNPEFYFTPLALSYVERMRTETYGYISVLESTVRQVSQALCGKDSGTINEILQAVDQLKRERNAAVTDLTIAKRCKVCKHDVTRESEDPCFTCLYACNVNNFEWRGLCLDNGGAVE